MFERIKSLYGLNYERNTVRIRNIPSCVLSSDISRVKTCEALPMGELIGSLYIWLRLVASYKVPKSFLTNTERVRFE